MKNPVAEVQSKIESLRGLMALHHLSAVELKQTNNLAWVTAGVPTYINEATDTSPLTVLITPDNAYAITTSIEAPRLRDEGHLDALGFELVVEKWHSAGAKAAELIDGRTYADDLSAPMAGAISALRTTLSPEEIARLRVGATLAAEAMNQAVRSVRPGDSEYQLAARLSAAARERGGLPIVNLIASDDRIFKYRHPLPTAKRVEKYAMLVLCMRWYGLVISVTRLIHFGKLTGEIAAKMAACARVDASLILGTKPGRTLGEMFEVAKAAYAAEGYPEAIDEHHQGGSAGYAPREVVAKPGNQTLIADGQAFAWNPSIRGVKSEDTVLITDSGPEVLTAIPGWPMIDVTLNGGHIARPAILEA